MSSPEHTLVTDGATVSKAEVPRSPKPMRVVGVLAAIVALAFASTACTPEQTAKDAIARYWGANAPCAERIVDRESNFQAGAVNPISGTTGLFQLHPVHAAWIKRTYGYDWAEMKDPFKNARVAKGLSSEAHRMYLDGWQPWRLSGNIVRGGGCPA